MISYYVIFEVSLNYGSKSENERTQAEDSERPRAAADARGERGLRQAQGVHPTPQAQPGTIFSDFIAHN